MFDKKSYIKLFIFVLFCVFIPFKFVNSQEVQFSGSAKTTVAVGERFRLTYSLNAEGNSFRTSAITDFNVLSGPNQSSNSSIQIVNGSMTQSVNYTFTLILEALKTGTFTIQPAYVKVKNKEYKSNSITINVVANGTNTNSQPSNTSANKQSNANSADVGNNDIFLKAIVDKANPIQGEQINVTYKIYTRIPISQYTINKLSSYSGFWSVDLMKDKTEPKQYNETINGQNYTVAEIRKTALFPQKSGTLTLEPLEVECLAQIRTQNSRNSIFDNFFNDPFFRNPFSESIQNVKKTIKSNPISINVKPLPNQNKPDNFKGSVGVYNLTSEVDKTNVKTNEAITIKISISGTGNVNTIESPEIIFPTDFEVYDPKITETSSNNGSKLGGIKTFEYLLIPRKGGTFNIKPIDFTYFDLSKGTYITLNSKEFIINVAKGSASEESNNVNSISKEDIKYIGSDIRYIVNKKFDLHQQGYLFFFSIWYFILLTIPVIVFVIVLYLMRKQIKLNKDIRLVKNRKATKVARKRLKIAENYLKKNQKSEFFNEISKAIWGYIADKFSISLATLSMETAIESLKSKNISEETHQKLVSLIDICEYSRFAPTEQHQDISVVYQQASDIITSIEKQLK